MDTSNILKTALGVGILGTLAVFLTYSYSGDDTIETGETNEGGDNLDTIQESATTMEASFAKVCLFASCVVLDRRFPECPELDSVCVRVF